MEWNVALPYEAEICAHGLNLDGFVGPEFVNWCRRVAKGDHRILDGRIAFETKEDFESFYDHFPAVLPK